MLPTEITNAIILASIALWIAWDIVAYRLGGTPATESAWWWRAPRWLVFLTGFLCGHWFWH
jgi:hypothetical protein